MLRNFRSYIRYPFSLLKRSIWEFNKDKAFRQGAAISYYTLFSLPAILIIVIRLAAIAFDEEQVKSVVLEQAALSLGEASANQIEYMINNISKQSNSWLATLIGLGTLIFGATGVFYSLQDSLNVVWKLPDKIRQGSIVKFIFDRLISFTMVLSLGFILMVSMVLNTLIVAVSTFLERTGAGFREILTDISPDLGYYADQFEVMFVFAYGMDAIVGLIIVTFTFALIYKFMSSANPKWKDVLIGALFAAVLFNVGKFLFGFYIGTTNIGSTYGAAGSVVLILLWVYYSSQILLLGAEFIYVHAKDHERDIKPSSIAAILVDQPLKRLREKFLVFRGRILDKQEEEEERIKRETQEALLEEKQSTLGGLESSGSS